MNDLAWRGDGRLLAAACVTKIQVWDMDSGALLSVLDGHQSAGIGVAFSHGGDLLASSFLGRHDNHLGPDQRPVAHPAPRGVPRLGPRRPERSDRADSRVISYELERGAECRTLSHGLVGNRTPPLTSGPWSVDFSPDGRLLASAGVDGVRIYRATDGVEMGHLAIGFAESAMFEPAGGLLTYNATFGLARWPARQRERQRGRLRPTRGSAIAAQSNDDVPLSRERSQRKPAPRHRPG